VIFEVKKPCGEWAEGDTVSADDLTAKGHSADRLMRRGAIAPVGFLSKGAPATEYEAANQIAELQRKIEALEDERDEAVTDNIAMKKKIRTLEKANEDGAAQLREAVSNLEQAAARVKQLEGDKPKG
jgi:septal ring factor EnvC (AmiA/AmiB activator)